MKRISVSLLLTVLFLLGFAAGVIVYFPTNAYAHVCSDPNCGGEYANCSPGSCPDLFTCCGRRNNPGAPCVPLSCNSCVSNPDCMDEPT